MEYQLRKNGEQVWTDGNYRNLKEEIMAEGFEYRLKPAAPKWPQTTMTELDLCHELTWGGNGHSDVPVLVPIANAAIAHACEAGQVVPAEVHDQKIKSEGQKWLAALQSGAKRERELGEALHKATMALAAQQKGVESSLIDGVVKRYLSPGKVTFFYGIPMEEMSHAQLLAVAAKGWELLAEARVPVDLACVS